MHPTQPHRLYPNASASLSTGATASLSTGALAKLSTGLGNVRTTITDRKIATFDSNWDITGYTADIKSANDYFPGGMLMPGRQFNGTDYRFGYQGSEKDDEIKGIGNSYTTFFRQYDPIIIRWLSVDPVTASWESPYAAMKGNPARPRLQRGCTRLAFTMQKKFIFLQY